VWALLVSLALVFGLGCSLGGDAGHMPGGETLGATRGSFVSPTEPLVCPPYTAPTIPGGLLPPTPAGDDVPGTIAGSFGVNDSGAATYAMALVVPPGRAGIAPVLGVVYDSDAENGPLGMGFRMTGLSAIRRCGHNFSDEGDLRAVNYDAGDRFCLDGRKLFSGSTPHEYATSPDALMRVRDQGDTDGLGPLSFTAYGADGRIYEYGATADARVRVANGAVATWSLTKVSDRVGNVMTFEYESFDAPDGVNVQRLRHIFYTGHTSGLAPEREVEFTYQPRWDVLTRYSAGEAFRADALLSNVRLFGPGHALVRDYAFTYELSPASQRSRLTSLHECTGEEPTRACKPGTFFSWGGTPAGFVNDIEHGASFPSAPSPGLTRLVMVRNADFNGDGTDDTAYLLNRYVPPGQPVPQVLFVKFNHGDPVTDPVTLAYEFAADADRPLIADLTPLDYDADGRADLLVHRGAPADGSPSFRWLHATGTGFADVTGVGTPRSTPVGPYANAEGRPVATYFTDLNGDSHPDVVSCRRRRSVFGGTTAPETSYWTYQLHSHVGDGFGDDKPLSYGALPGGGNGPLSSLDGLSCATTDVLTMDLDGDGANELLFAERGSGIVVAGEHRGIAHLPVALSEKACLGPKRLAPRRGQRRALGSRVEFVGERLGCAVRAQKVRSAASIPPKRSRPVAQQCDRGGAHVLGGVIEIGGSSAAPHGPVDGALGPLAPVAHARKASPGAARAHRVEPRAERTPRPRPLRSARGGHGGDDEGGEPLAFEPDALARRLAPLVVHGDRARRVGLCVQRYRAKAGFAPDARRRLRLAHRHHGSVGRDRDERLARRLLRPPVPFFNLPRTRKRAYLPRELHPGVSPQSATRSVRRLAPSWMIQQVTLSCPATSV
jgi:FG-GAP-like repeat/Salmonella virulence plasmid 65kDa B protein